MSKTEKITKSAVLTALSVVLSIVSRLLPAPWLAGGNITLASMVPIIVVAVMFGTKWGLISASTFSLIQIITNFYVPPAASVLSFTGAVLFDYVFAFSCLGLAGIFARMIPIKSIAIPLSGAIVTTIRYLMHIISGVLIWSAYANTENALVYSLVYNGSYMIPEIIITTVVLALITPKLNNSITIKHF